MTPYNLVGAYQRFKGTWYSSSLNLEKLVSTYQAIRFVNQKAAHHNLDSEWQDDADMVLLGVSGLPYLCQPGKGEGEVAPVSE
jgi:hypothetical protein